MYLAIDVLFYFEKAKNLLRRSVAVIEKLARARKATPNYKMERSPPIILNHYSTTFLSGFEEMYLREDEDHEGLSVYWGLQVILFRLFGSRLFLGEKTCTWGQSRLTIVSVAATHSTIAAAAVTTTAVGTAHSSIAASYSSVAASAS
jgi:hypothetical protein